MRRAVERPLAGVLDRRDACSNAEIQSGRFAREWVLENTAGQPSFKAMRRGAATHQIEEVGERLRAMMPWIKQNALVDKSKN